MPASLNTRTCAARIRQMAETMQHHRAGPEGACTVAHLMAAGFSAAEVERYAPAARALLSGRPPIVLAGPPGRAEARALVRQAQAIRRQAAR